MAGNNHNVQASIALNRFGLGKKFGEAAPSDPVAWLDRQIDSYNPASPAFAQNQTTREIAESYVAARKELAGKDADAKTEMRKNLRQENNLRYRSEVNSRVVAALTTPTPFAERLTYFWSNHFAVSANKPQVTALAGAFEREAIRPHVMGRFSDMLITVEQHPAMLFFLDQFNSTGPNSRLALNATQRNAKRHPVKAKASSPTSFWV